MHIVPEAFLLTSVQFYRLSSHHADIANSFFQLSFVVGLCVKSSWFSNVFAIWSILAFLQITDRYRINSTINVGRVDNHHKIIFDYFCQFMILHPILSQKLDKNQWKSMWIKMREYSSNNSVSLKTAGHNFACEIDVSKNGKPKNTRH